MITDLNLEALEILPDSRLLNPTGLIWRPDGWYVRVFCANCGADKGCEVPEANMTFVCYLCDSCSEKYGGIANLMMMPDEIFFGLIAAEQLESYGRYLSEEEMIQEMQDGTSSLAKLLSEGDKIINEINLRS